MVNKVSDVDGAGAEVLVAAAIFQGVDAAAVAALIQRLRPAHFPIGHAVFTEGEPGDWLYLIVSGKVKIVRYSADGRANLVAVMGPADMFGELSLFDPGPRTSSAITLTEVRAVRMDRAALRWWISQRPDIAQQLLRVLARRLRRTNGAMAGYLSPTFPDGSRRPCWSWPGASVGEKPVHCG